MDWISMVQIVKILCFATGVLHVFSSLWLYGSTHLVRKPSGFKSSSGFCLVVFTWHAWQIWVLDSFESSIPISHPLQKVKDMSCGCVCKASGGFHEESRKHHLLFYCYSGCPLTWLAIFVKIFTYIFCQVAFQLISILSANIIVILELFPNIKNASNVIPQRWRMRMEWEIKNPKCILKEWNFYRFSELKENFCLIDLSFIPVLSY